jgi:hypothetical protein
MERPKYFDASYLRNNGGLDRNGGEKLLAEMLRQRQRGMFGGRHPALRGMGGHGLPIPGAHSMMGGHPRHSFPPPMEPPPMGVMGMGGMGRMGGMPMGMGMGMGRGIGMNPHMGMGGIEMGGMGMGIGRHPLGHSPFGQRCSPLGFPSAGLPRAHSFLPQHCHSHAPFIRPRPSPFSSRMMFDELDEYEDDYCLPLRRGFGQSTKSSFRFAPQRQHPRRRSYHPPPSVFDHAESDDDYDDYDDYEDDSDDEVGFEDHIPRRSPYMRLRGY